MARFSYANRGAFAFHHVRSSGGHPRSSRNSQIELYSYAWPVIYYSFLCLSPGWWSSCGVELQKQVKTWPNKPAAPNPAIASMRSEDERVVKFRLLPKTREEWMRAFCLPFQSYVVVAFVALRFFSAIWPQGTTGSEMHRSLRSFYEFRDNINFGYGVCVAMLSYGGIMDLIGRRWGSGCLNLCLAAFSAWMYSTTSGWVVA